LLLLCSFFRRTLYCGIIVQTEVGACGVTYWNVAHGESLDADEDKRRAERVCREKAARRAGLYFPALPVARVAFVV